MPKQSRPDDEKAGTLGMPNPASSKEQAEGSRENVNVGTSGGDATTGNAGANAGGITNRPLDREEQEQEQLPPRGKAKEGGHA